MALEIGSPAPLFSLPDADGGPVALSSFAGRKLVLYFYPKDDTSGCTREAKDFTALKSAFAAADTDIVGISPDAPASKAKFARKYGLSVTLAADEEKEAARAYGVWVEKSMWGRRYMGIERSTFLIGRDGTIARIWPKVSVAGHAEEVLAAAQAL